MAFQIRVYPDALRKASAEIRGLGDQSDVVCDSIKSMTHRLDDSWDGPASQQMVHGLLDLSSVITHTKDGLYEGAEMLEAVASGFESIDNGENIPVFQVKALDMHILGPGGRPDFSSSGLFTGNIRVIPDELRAASGEAKSTIGKLEEISESLMRIVNNLQNDWEGKACIRFSEKITELKNAYVELIKLFEDFFQRILFAANRYEEIDNMLS